MRWKHPLEAVADWVVYEELSVVAHVSLPASTVQWAGIYFDLRNLERALTDEFAACFVFKFTIWARILMSVMYNLPVASLQNKGSTNWIKYALD